MIDTTPVANEIYLIVAGVAEREFLLAVVHRFPELTSAELSQALQAAMAQAERHVVRKHRSRHDQNITQCAGVMV